MTGEVDLASAPELAWGLERALRSGKDVLVDLEGVEFMDCVGLRTLVEASGGEADVTVTPGPRQVQRLYELTRVDRLLRVVSPPRNMWRAA